MISSYTGPNTGDVAQMNMGKIGLYRSTTTVMSLLEAPCDKTS